ncbi:MAG: hypothetical protein KGL39_31810 [Patescibacteria group bacterium]|nr:hypothetical protein [Patescibacteria group bacterium]
MSALTQRTLELLKAAQGGLRKDATTAGLTTGTGLTYYNLEPAAKLLYPVLTPLRNSIPRVGKIGAGYGTAAHWKAITAINPTGIYAGVSEGNRGAQISVTEKDYTAAFKGIGLENSATFESVYGAEGFDDERALAVLTSLQALMLAEEQMILTGNTSLALGTTPTPTVTLNAGTGSFAASTSIQVACVALTPFGMNQAGASGPVVTQFTRTNQDGSTDTINGGQAAISALSTAVTSSSTADSQTATATVTPVKGAAGYAWFVTNGGTTLATSYLAGITSVPSFTFSALPATTNQAGNATGLSSDHSTNTLDFDGLITQALNGGGYYVDLSAAKLTADGEGGVVEIDAALKYFWDTYKISPSSIRVGSQQQKDISTKVLSGSTNPVYRIQLENGGQRSATAGSLVTSYLNKYGLGGARELPIELHPNMPAGVILFDLETVPYPNSNVPTARRIRTRQEYYQQEWPLTSRKYQYGVYADEVLQVYVPFGMGVISGILAG